MTETLNPTDSTATPPGWPSAEATRLHQLLFGYLTSRAIFSALELGLFDSLESEPGPAEQVGARLGLPERPARLLLLALQGEQLVERTDGGVYRNAPVASRFLVSSSPESVRLLAMHQAGHYTRFDQLTEALRKDEPVRTAFGGDYRAFGGPEGLTGVTRNVAEMMMAGGLAQHADLGAPGRRLVDLGCGSGVYSIALALAHPQLQITAVEQPANCPLIERNVAEAGLADQITVTPGDIFVDRFSGDAALLSNLVEGFAPPKSRELVKHVHGWLPEGGELLIHSPMWELAQTPFPYQIGLILLLNNTAGGEPHSEHDHRAYLQEAGFGDVRPGVAVSPISALVRAVK